MGCAASKKPETLQIDFNNASFHFHEKKYQAALNILKKHSENELSDDALLLRGKCHFYMGQFEQAANDFALIIQKSPDHISALRYQAQATYEIGAFDRSLYYCDRYLEAFKRQADLQNQAKLQKEAKLQKQAERQKQADDEKLAHPQSADESCDPNFNAEKSEATSDDDFNFGFSGSSFDFGFDAITPESNFNDEVILPLRENARQKLDSAESTQNKVIEYAALSEYSVTILGNSEEPLEDIKDLPTPPSTFKK